MPDCQVMTTTRLETFSDGVLAIIITVMVLELKVPAGSDLTALRHATGSGLSTYLLSFVYIGIYWNNHHHLFQLTGHITGSILWANLHLLFWLSLLPFTTAWMDETGFATTPITVYGVNLLAAALALCATAARHHPLPGGRVGIAAGGRARRQRKDLTSALPRRDRLRMARWDGDPRRHHRRHRLLRGRRDLVAGA
jgi:uncharacterized membrane protein